MPRTEQQNEILRNERESMLKNAALELFALQGYRNTSIREIADMAGVSKGLIYNYYDSKKSLLVAVVKDAIGEGDKLMEMTRDESLNPLDILLKIAISVFDLIESDLNHWKFFTSLSLQDDIREELQEVLDDYFNSGLEQYYELFRRLGAEDAEDEAFFFAAFLDGILLGRSTRGEKYPMASMKEKMEEFIINRYPR